MARARTNGAVADKPVGVPANNARVDKIPIGRTGLQYYGRLVYEEYETKLQGERGQKIFIRMRDDDSVVGAVLLAIELLIRQVKWRIVPADLPEELEQQLQKAQAMIRVEQQRIKDQQMAALRAKAEAAANQQQPAQNPAQPQQSPPTNQPPGSKNEPATNQPKKAADTDDVGDIQEGPEDIDTEDVARLTPLSEDPRFAAIYATAQEFKDKAERVAQFVRECFADMTETWEDNLSEILTFLVFGWSLLEVLYKIRAGEQSSDMTLDSKYTDGMIGWRSWSIRAQESLQGWDFDPNTGSPTAMIQRPAPTFTEYTIPFEKALHFRTTTQKGNPEGRSVLRNAYRSWYFKRHIEEIEAVGIERDLAGIPVVWMPPEMMLPTASANDKAVAESMKNLAVNIRNDEQAGVVFPLSYDKNNNKRFDITLVASPGRRQFDTSAVVQRYNQSIAMSMLADVILLGHEKVGSYALSEQKRDLFSTALGAWLDMIQAVITKQGIARLCKLNQFPPELYPAMQHEDIQTPNLKELGDFIQKISQAGMSLFPSSDGSVERYLLEAGSLPVPADANDAM